MSTPEPKPVDPENLRPGPIRHVLLSAELLQLVQAVYDVVGPYLEINLEQFEIGFMRETHPEHEVAVWCDITAAWIAYHEQHLGKRRLPVDNEKKLLAALIAISTGVGDASALDVPVDVGRNLLACYDDLGEE